MWRGNRRPPGDRASERGAPVGGYANPERDPPPGLNGGTFTSLPSHRPPGRERPRSVRTEGDGGRGLRHRRPPSNVCDRMRPVPIESGRLRLLRRGGSRPAGGPPDKRVVPGGSPQNFFSSPSTET